MSELSNSISQLPLLEGATSAQVEALAEQAQLRRILARDRLQHPSPDGHCYFIQQGRVRLTRSTPDGNIFLGLCRPNDIFGLEALLSERNSVDGVALDASTIILIPCRAFDHLQNEYPVFVQRFARQLYEQHLHVLDRLEDMVRFNVPDRLIRFLAYLAQSHGNPREDGAVLIDVGLSHQDLAVSIGTSRETATTLLNDLKADGILLIGRKTLTVLDLPALDSRARAVVGRN